MFNLDQAVEKWREKMFAAGIRKSTSLDELEIHLRDHIERLAREGNSVEAAFDAAIQKIGQIDVLKREFAKAEGFSGWLDAFKSRGAQRILAVVWMAASGWLLLTYALLRFIWRIRATFMSVDVLVVLAATCGIIGSALLSSGSLWGRRIVWTLGFFMAAVCIAEVFFLIPRWLEGGLIAGRAAMVCGALTSFGLITVAILRSTPQPNSRPKARIEQASAAPAPYASQRTAVIDVKRDPTMPGVIHQKVRLAAVICLFAAALLVVLGGPWFWMRRIETLQESPFAQDPRFVVTKLPLSGVHRNCSFSPSPKRNVCSIYGLLAQCTEVSGVRYVIAKDVAAGEVEFGGYTNSLTAPQFVQAFTQALQTNRPEFINFRTQRHYRENLVLLTNDARTVLVLSKAMAREFEGAGK
jgi:hypothetical protein